MFTGIIETLGKVVELEKAGGNVLLTIESAISQELKVDQSVSHNGVCLTVTEVNGNRHRVTAIAETLQRSTFQYIERGDVLNLERAALPSSRLDGHLVQGHVDQMAECVAVEDAQGSRLYTFQYRPSKNDLIVEKGSIAVDGVSLTVVQAEGNRFSVAIIPYTFEHTSFRYIQPGGKVNIEFDIVGKYIAKLYSEYR